MGFVVKSLLCSVLQYCNRLEQKQDWPVRDNTEWQAPCVYLHKAVGLGSTQKCACTHVCSQWSWWDQPETLSPWVRNLKGSLEVGGGQNSRSSDDLIIIIIIYPLTARVIGAPQMISQAISSIFPHSPLPSGTWQTQGLSIPWCLPTSSSVCLLFISLSLCLVSWFGPDPLNRRHDHTTAVCISLRWSDLHVVLLPAGSWHRFPHW